MTMLSDMICKPFSVSGDKVPATAIANAIDRLANLPNQFMASDLSLAFPMVEWRMRQEATNRLMQRWRKLGLAEFSRGRWKLTKGAWDVMQMAAVNARRAAA